MAVTIARSAFDSAEEPRLLTSSTLNIDGFDCTVYESQTIVSRDSLTIYKSEVRAVKNIHNDLLYEYLKGNIQRLHSQLVMGSNPFKVVSGDYTFVARKVTLTIGIDCFAIFFDGMLCQPMPSNTL